MISCRAEKWQVSFHFPRGRQITVEDLAVVLQADREADTQVVERVSEGQPAPSQSTEEPGIGILLGGAVDGGDEDETLSADESSDWRNPTPPEDDESPLGDREPPLTP